MRTFCAAILVLCSTQMKAQDIAPPIVALLSPEGYQFSISTDDIESVNLDENSPTFNQITFKFNADVSALFGNWTADKVGSPIAVNICGEEVLRPILQTPIQGGVISLSGFTQHKAREIANVLRGVRNCGESSFSP